MSSSLKPRLLLHFNKTECKSKVIKDFYCQEFPSEPRLSDDLFMLTFFAINMMNCFSLLIIKERAEILRVDVLMSKTRLFDC